MSSADQVTVRAIAGNDRCMECGMKSPQWASVSFGTVFCLECSGVHRYVLFPRSHWYSFYSTFPPKNAATSKK
eukprot:scaffold244121_cov46-Attheya_sp.AAC.1